MPVGPLGGPGNPVPVPDEEEPMAALLLRAPGVRNLHDTVERVRALMASHGPFVSVLEDKQGREVLTGQPFEVIEKWDRADERLAQAAESLRGISENEFHQVLLEIEADDLDPVDAGLLTVRANLAPGDAVALQSRMLRVMLECLLCTLTMAKSHVNRVQRDIRQTLGPADVKERLDASLEMVGDVLTSARSDLEACWRGL